MQKVGRVKFTGVFIVVLIFLLTASSPATSQGLETDTKKIERLIREWNYANNARNTESFENVYASRLLFYTQPLAESDAIDLKRKLFNLKPHFRQRIISDLTYLPFASGVIKVDFTKEVLEKSGWKKHPSYLLVRIENNDYRIVGESDYVTDKALRYRLEPGELMVLGAPGGNHKGMGQDSALSATPSSGLIGVRAIREFLQSLDLSAGIDALSSMGTVTIPKGYVLMLVGMLAIGGLMIFIADSARSRNGGKGTVGQKAVSLQNRMPPPPAVSAQNGLSRHKGERGENVIRAFKMQSEFEAFVMTLFDPLYFRHRKPKVERVSAGKVLEREYVPDLEFDFNHKDTRATFAIKCLYYKNRSSGELQLFSAERQQAFWKFEEERKMDLYYVLGIGGTPDDPKELYLVPSQAIRSEFVRKDLLTRYGKSGMFFYNSAAGKLQ